MYERVNYANGMYEAETWATRNAERRRVNVCEIIENTGRRDTNG